MQEFVPWLERFEWQLERLLPRADSEPTQLHGAMRYAVLGGGKRLRALLVYAAGSACGAELDALDAPAAAVEIIHAYSLVHDDLPAMDDDELRRGKPTCHIAYGEATAILAGDALQALAFELLANSEFITERARLALVRTLAQACGSLGMAGGQAFDLAAVGRALNERELARMHAHKTGALIAASVMMGVLCSKQPARSKYDAFERYGRELGMAFQIHDDVLDVEGETTVIGKPKGSDARKSKPTYPSIIGLDQAKLRAQLHGQSAVEAISETGLQIDKLKAIARYVVERRH
jgi:farnesyl diphosphate synthase